MDDDTLNFENVVYNDKNRHQVNLMKCCAEPEKFLYVLEKLKQTILNTTETDPQKNGISINLSIESM